jgi:alpha-L-fucosidase
LLLNIGPDPTGELPAESLDRLAGIGAWLSVNGEAIYGTRPVTPWKEAKTCFTSLPDGTVYAIYLGDDDEPAPPGKLMIFSMAPRPGTQVRLLGVKEPVRWEKAGKGVLLILPERAVKDPPCRHAWVFKLRPEPGGER